MALDVSMESVAVRPAIIQKYKKHKNTAQSCAMVQSWTKNSKLR